MERPIANPASLTWPLHKQDVQALGLILLVWLIIGIAIDPSGDFPVNDDWMFGASVAALLSGEGLRVASAFHGIIVPPLLTQIPWGALFSLPAGYSFAALRLSTLTLGFVGLVTMFLLLRDAGSGRRLALLATLALAANPLFVALSGTFLTDVPLTVLMLLSVFAFNRSMMLGSRSWLLGAIIVSLAALLTRQVGMAPLIGYALAHAIRSRFRPLPVLAGLVPLAVGLAVFFAYQAWLTGSQRGPALEHLASTPAIDAVALVAWAARFLLFSFAYVGLAMVPVVLAIGLLPAAWRGTTAARIALPATIAACVAACFLLWLKNDLIPVLGNIIQDTGMGPLTQRDTLLLRLNLPSVGPGTRAFWLAVTFCGVAGFAAFVLRGAAPFLPRQRGTGELHAKTAPIQWLAAGTALGYWAIITVRSYQNNELFDRYLLPIMPIALILFVVTGGQARRLISARQTGLALAALVAMGSLSVAGTHDYLAWNRARWAALHHLTDELGISPLNIDGGYEFNGRMEHQRGYQSPPGKSWWFVHGDDYLLASGPMEGYREIARFPVRGKLLPVGLTHVLVLNRTKL